MPFFPCAHAAHPLWKHAVRQVIVQLSAQISMQKLEDMPCLGIVYVSAPYAAHAGDVVALLAKSMPQVQHWVGCAGHSVLAGDMDYGPAGAVAVMLTYVPAQHYQVFSGFVPQVASSFAAHGALVHGDATSTALSAHLNGLQQQWQCITMVGGVSDLQNQHAQWAWGSGNMGYMPASIGGGGVQVGGLSGVAFSASVDCLAVGMHACKPVGHSYTMTKVDGEVVLELDGRPALPVLLGETDCDGDASAPSSRQDAWWNKLAQTLLAMTPAGSEVHSNCVAPEARVLRVAGVDWQRQGIVLHCKAEQGSKLTQCLHDEQAAHADMRRACAQVLDSLTCDVAQLAGEPDAEGSAGNGLGRSICGAIYIRNQARNTPARTPQVDAELQWIRHALGPVPLLGFTSSAEIEAAQLQHLSAQLLVFTQPLQAWS